MFCHIVQSPVPRKRGPVVLVVEAQPAQILRLMRNIFATSKDES